MIRCPLCHQPTKWQDNPSRPFCSERCRLIDLGEWYSENRRIAGNTESACHDDKSPLQSDHYFE
ncbi:DNA gyrase inhibitor YacG [Ectothiorhodospiraceae bacterium BW-2]|nr:DNA gyrase inhibitor YacG [Ectothiorhodospiraceae bacterium BW-2]